MGLGKPIRFERSGDRQVDQVQRNLIQVLAPVLSSPMGDGQRRTGVAVTANTVTRVAHGLGRPYQGVMLLRFVAAAGAALASTPAALGEVNPQPPGLAAQSVDVVCSQTGTADLWVY